MRLGMQGCKVDSLVNVVVVDHRIRVSQVMQVEMRDLVSVCSTVVVVGRALEPKFRLLSKLQELE